MTDMAEVRKALRRAGIDADELGDEDARAVLARLGADDGGAGPRPVNGRLWLREALVRGGFHPPENRAQRARLDDGGPTVHLAVLGMLVMRHTGGARPPGWTDEALAAQIHQPVEDFRRGQQLLDDVAALTGLPAIPEPYWWLRT